MRGLQARVDGARGREALREVQDAVLGFSQNTGEAVFDKASQAGENQLRAKDAHCFRQSWPEWWFYMGRDGVSKDVYLCAVYGAEEAVGD